MMQLAREFSTNEQHEHGVVHPRQQQDHTADRPIRPVVGAKVLDVQAEQQRRENPEDGGDDGRRDEVRPLLLDIRQQLEQQHTQRDDEGRRHHQLECREQADTKGAEVQGAPHSGGDHLAVQEDERGRKDDQAGEQQAGEP